MSTQRVCTVAVKLVAVVVLLSSVAAPAAVGASAGDQMWKRYEKLSVFENYDTYIPSPEDLGVYAGLVPDAETLLPSQTAYQFAVVGFRTYAYVAFPTDI